MNLFDQNEIRSSGWVPGVKKIAVVRANAIGDYIFSLPALQALRNTYPDAEIVLLGREIHTELVNTRPGPADRAVVIPPIRGVSLPDWEEGESASEDQDNFFHTMSAERFDLAIQLHGGGAFSNHFTRQLGARLTVGMRSNGTQLLDRSIPYVYFQSEILRLLEVVSLVGASCTDIEPRLEITAADLEGSLREVPHTDRPLVGMHVGAGDPRRRWSPEHFAEVGDALARQGVQILLTGTGIEGEAITRVQGTMHELALDLRDRLSLGELAGLFSRCRLVISNDSGPLHMAAAVGTPTVGIFWCGNLINAGPFTRTRHRPAISWRLHCPVCGNHIIAEPCSHSVSFVDDVTVQEVLGSAQELVDFEKAMG